MGRSISHAKIFEDVRKMWRPNARMIFYNPCDFQNVWSIDFFVSPENVSLVECVYPVLIAF